jgi:uncharacterized membrane protein YjjB (DUF3815 family)
MDVSDRSRSSVFVPTLIGTALQLLMVVVGHFSPTVAQTFAALGMGISGVAGVLAGRGVPATSWGSAAGRGAIAGGVSAFIGILVSYLLGDVPAQVLGFGTAASTVSGALGGLIGRSLSKRPINARSAS